jgi:sialate O-acetylesterase
MRAAQADALVLGSTGMVATIDSGDVNSLHPNNKVVVARRLANLVLNRLYGQNVSGLGPKMDSYRSMGRKIVLHFDNVGSGLSLRLKRGITELELADIKGQFFPAQAEVEGSQLTVWSDYVVNPTELRYGWRNSPSATIFNSDNLPAAPFKVDISVRP